MDSLSARPVIVGGCRTPFARAGRVLRDHDALALSGHALDGLLERCGIGSAQIDALRWGIVVVDPRRPQLARELVLRGPLPPQVRAVTVTDNCITGATVVVDLARELAAGRARVAIAGGVDSMSNPALQFSRPARRRFLDLANARTAMHKLEALLALRPGHFLPDPPAVVEPSTGLSMGEHCEQMVRQWRIGREAQDAVALRSHQRAAAAAARGWFDGEIRALDGVATDSMIRTDTSIERLAALPTVFDGGPGATITAGSASALTDGAAALMMTTESYAREHDLPVLARIVGYEFAALAPSAGLLMAPAVAVPRLLARHGLSLEDLDRFEIHEAFAGQVLCNLAAWEQGWKEPAIGRLDPARINLAGGSLAIGHPFAATGIRLLLTLARQLHDGAARRGLVSICGAGGTAAAVLLEAP